MVVLTDLHGRRELSMNLKVASIGATAVLPFAIVGLLAERALFATRPGLVTVQVLAVILVIWARLTFGMRSLHYKANPTAGGLVTNGPYRFVRHPIYAAILFFVWAGVASHTTLLSVGVGILVSAATAMRIVAEERLVTARYPEYVAYAARTKRVIPFLV
jgi:protein-S-isoprenylcysteine O-methyltransferase Ste14